MLRFFCMGVSAAVFCALQSGCCCCRLPMGAPIVVKPPQVVVNAPPLQPPPLQPPPVVQPANDVNRPKDLSPPKDLVIKDVNAPKDLVKEVNAPKDRTPPDLKPLPAKEKFNPPPPADGPKEYVYSQSTGEFKLGDELLGKGSSGTGAGTNNAAMQDKKNLGPIPAGVYSITVKAPFGKTNEPSFRLQPKPSTNTFHRWVSEGFQIVPDTGNNRAGDIVLPREARDRIEWNANPPFNTVRVVP
jgi:hypothetical protein